MNLFVFLQFIDTCLSQQLKHTFNIDFQSDLESWLLQSLVYPFFQILLEICNPTDPTIFLARVDYIFFFKSCWKFTTQLIFCFGLIEFFDQRDLQIHMIGHQRKSSSSFYLRAKPCKKIFQD